MGASSSLLAYVSAESLREEVSASHKLGLLPWSSRREVREMGVHMGRQEEDAPALSTCLLHYMYLGSTVPLKR